MPGGHGLREATSEDEQDRVAREFAEEIGGRPPRERSLLAQILGWSYILTGFGLAVVTMRETGLDGLLTFERLGRGLAVAAYVTVGVAVDNEKDWAIWPALALSTGTVYAMGPAALEGQPLHALAALAHLALIVALPLHRWLDGPPERPT